MKRQKYIKPTMQVIKIHQTHILCGSPTSLGLYDDDSIDNENNVW